MLQTRNRRPEESSGNFLAEQKEIQTPNKFERGNDPGNGNLWCSNPILVYAIGVKANVKGEKILITLEWLAAMCSHVQNKGELWG